jgi:O-antigen ligase
MVASVFVSALGGELQHLLGFGPQLGAMWPEDPDMEFMRVHTGGGGILLDAFTPYCAAILLISVAGSSWLKHSAAWLLALWGTANILRGGMLALAVGLCWYLCMAPRATRKRIILFMSVGLVCGALLFGGTIAGKMLGTGNEVNTSGRFDEWPQLLKWIGEEPFVGHGPNADMDLLAKSPGGRDLRASHNELLSTGVNYGIIGILLLWTPLLSLLARGVLQTAHAPREGREEMCGATAILLMVVVLSFTDNTLRTPGVMIIGLVPAAIAGIGRSKAGAYTLIKGSTHSTGASSIAV